MSTIDEVMERQSAELRTQVNLPVRLDAAPMKPPVLEKNPTYLPLLKAALKRGAFRPGTTDLHVAVFESMREATKLTGHVTTAQQMTLKRNVMLITGATSVTIMLDFDNHKVVIQLGKGTKHVTDRDSLLKTMVLGVLGEGWDVTCSTLTPNDSGPAQPSRRPAQRKRTRRAKKARRSRK